MPVSIGDAVLYIHANMDSLNATLGNVRQAIDEERGHILDAARTIGIGLTAMGAAITAPLVLASSQFQDFNKSMREVNSLVGLSEPEFKALSQSVRDLAVSLGTDAVDASRGLYEIFSAISGVKPDEAMKLLEVASKAAVAGVTDTKTAVDGLTTIINAWKLKTSEATAIADQMFVAVKEGKVTFGELSGSIAIAAPLAASLGIPLKDLLSTVVTISKQGTPAAEAFTEMRSVMLALLRPTEEMQNAFQKLGVANGEALIKQKGLQGAMEALRGVADETGVAVIKLTGRAEGMQAILQTTGANAAGAARDLQIMGDTAGATEKALAEVQKGRALDLFSAQAKELSLTIGQALAPALTTTIGLLGDVVMAVTNFAKVHPDLTTGLIVAAGAFGTFALAAGPLLVLLPNIVESIGILTVAWATFGGPAITAGISGMGAGLMELLGFFGFLNPAVLAAGLAMGAFAVAYAEIGKQQAINDQLNISINLMNQFIALADQMKLPKDFQAALAESAGRAALSLDANAKRLQFGLAGWSDEAVNALTQEQLALKLLDKFKSEGGLKPLSGTIPIPRPGETEAEAKVRLKRQADEAEAAKKAEEAYQKLANTLGVKLSPSLQKVTADGKLLLTQMEAHGEKAQKLHVAQLQINDDMEKAKIAEMSYANAFLYWRDQAVPAITAVAEYTTASGEKTAATYSLTIDYLHKLEAAIVSFSARSIALMDFLAQPDPLITFDAILQKQLENMGDLTVQNKIMRDQVMTPIQVPIPDKQKFDETFKSMGDIAKRQISTIVTDFSKGFADILFSGGSWGEKIIDLFKKIGEGIVRAWIESGVVGLLSGKGFAGFSGFFSGLMDAITGKKTAKSGTGGTGGSLLDSLLGGGLTLGGAGVGAGLLGNKLGGGTAGAISGAAAGGLGAFLGGTFLTSAIGAGGGIASGMAGLMGALSFLGPWGLAAAGAAIAAGPIIHHFTRRGREKEQATSAIEELSAQVWGPDGIIASAKAGTISADEATAQVTALWDEYVNFLHANLKDSTVIQRSIDSQRHVISDAAAALAEIQTGTEAVTKEADIAAARTRIEGMVSEMINTGAMSAAFSDLIKQAGVDASAFNAALDVSKLTALQSGFAGLRDELVKLQPVEEDVFQKFLSTGIITDELKAKIVEYGNSFDNVREGALAAIQTLGAFQAYADAQAKVTDFSGLGSLLDGLNKLAPAVTDPINSFLQLGEITPELAAKFTEFGLSIGQFQEFADLAGMKSRFDGIASSFEGTQLQIDALSPIFVKFGGDLAALNSAAALPGLEEQRNQLAEWQTEIERFLPHVDKLKTSQADMMAQFFKTGDISPDLAAFITGAGGNIAPFQSFGDASQLLAQFEELKANFKATKDESQGLADFVTNFGGAAANAAIAGGAAIKDVLGLVQTYLEGQQSSTALAVSTELANMKTGVELEIQNLRDKLNDALLFVGQQLNTEYENTRLALVGQLTTIQTSLNATLDTTRNALVIALNTLTNNLGTAVTSLQTALTLAINNLANVIAGGPSVPIPTTTTPMVPPEGIPNVGITTGLRGVRDIYDPYQTGYTDYSPTSPGYTEAYNASTYNPYAGVDVVSAGTTSNADTQPALTTTADRSIYQTNIFNDADTIDAQRRMLIRVNDALVNQLAAY